MDTISFGKLTKTANDASSIVGKVQDARLIESISF